MDAETARVVARRNRTNPPRARVALVATITDFGGIEQVLLTLLHHMDADIELFPVLFTRKDADQNSFFDQLESLGVPHATFVNTKKRRYVNAVRNVRDALSIFRTQRFDLVHCHGYRADLLGLIVSKRFGLPVVATVHGFTPNDRYLRLYKRLDVSLLRRFTAVMAVSAPMKEDLVRLGLDAARVKVITNAVSEVATAGGQKGRGEIRSRLGIRDGEFVFGFVGRLSEEKGLSYLFSALKEFSSETVRARAVLVGDGPQRSMLERMVHDLSLTNRVDFVGFQADTSAWYRAMDAFVLPSLTEGTPMALLEAMAHQVPVIATAVGGVPAIVENQRNGILVPPADPTRLREAMEAIANDPALRRRLAEEAVQSVRQQFDVHTWARKVREVYTSAIERREAIA